MYKKNIEKTVIDDGFAPFLVEGAEFEGCFEFPVIKGLDSPEIPLRMIPFDKISCTSDYDAYVCFYIHDIKFRDIILQIDSHIDKLKKFKGVITPDCSLYRDMPLSAQISNTYINRAIGTYLQRNGISVIPTVRWGDERSYSNVLFKEKFAFTSIPPKSIIAIGTYGCIKTKENRYHFTQGLKDLITELQPEVILVYGAMPAIIFDQFKARTTFVQYLDWTSERKGHSTNG